MKEEDSAFAYIYHIIEKFTIFHSMGANELIGQLNVVFLGHKFYVEKDDRLSETDKSALIDKNTCLILDILNYISALGEVYSEIEKYKIQIKKE